MFYSNLVTGPTVLIWENACCLATGGPMKIPRPGSSRTRSVAQFMNLKQCYLRMLYSWYVLPQLGQKCFLNYSMTHLCILCMLINFFFTYSIKVEPYLFPLWSINFLQRSHSGHITFIACLHLDVENRNIETKSQTIPKQNPNYDSGLNSLII
jgi:hypothetical protein